MFKSGLLIGEQETHAKTLLDSLYWNGVANDLSETGCGKTYVACAIASALNRKVVVVCPKTVKHKWTSLLKVFGVVPTVVVNYEKLIRGNTKWLTYNDPPIGPNGKPLKDYPRWALTRLHFPDNALVILDEAHRCKGVSSLCAGLMIACKKQNYKLLNLTATLAVDPREMRAAGYANNLMRSYDNKSYKQFALHFGAEWLGRWGALTFNGEDSKAQAKMRELHNSLFKIQRCASRLTRVQMAEHFSKNHVTATAYTMDDVETRKIQAVYDWLEAELDKMYAHFEKYKDCILTVISEARQRVEFLKVPLFCELIEDAYDEGNSVICFVNYSRTLEAIHKKLSHRKDLKDLIGLIRGGQKDAIRQADIEAFQANTKRLMLANQAAGGIAIDLHDLDGKFPREVYLSPDFNARNILQAMGRADRIGAKSPIYQSLVYVAGTIEEKAVARFQAKSDNLALLNDGDLTMGLKLYQYPI